MNDSTITANVAALLDLVDIATAGAALFDEGRAECCKAYEAADAGTAKAARDIYGDGEAWRHFASPALIEMDRVLRAIEYVTGKGAPR